MEGFAAEVGRQGYKPRTGIRPQLILVSYLSRWLAGEGLEPSVLFSPEVVEEFFAVRRAAGYTNLDRTGGDRALGQVAVAHHQPLTGRASDVRVGLEPRPPHSLERDRDHLTRRQTAQLIQVWSRTSGGVLGVRIGLMHYSQHQAYLPRRLQPASLDLVIREGTPPSFHDLSSTTSRYSSGIGRLKRADQLDRSSGWIR